jgi:alpha-maltose-1-phosphate synthase
MVRALFVNENGGGHATVHANLLTELHRHGDMETRRYDLPRDSLARSIFAGALRMPSGWDFDFVLARAQLVQSAIAARSVVRLAKGCDVVHFYSQNAAPLLPAAVARLPYVVTTDASCAQTARMLEYRYPGRGTALSVRAAQILEQRCFAGAAAIVAQSEWARRSLIGDAGVDPARVQVLRLGAPREQPWIERPVRKLPRVAYVGFSMRRKGGGLLLDMLGPELGQSCELHIVTTARLMPRPGLHVRSDVRPGDGKIFRVLQDVDLLVLPSDADMSPNVILEAMASGLPVVTLATGALPEMVAHGTTGFVVPSTDTRALREAIDQLLASPARRREFGVAGRERLIRCFNAETEAGRLADILRAVAGKPGHRRGVGSSGDDRSAGC